MDLHLHRVHILVNCWYNATSVPYTDNNERDIVCLYLSGTNDNINITLLQDEMWNMLPPCTAMLWTTCGLRRYGLAETEINKTLSTTRTKTSRVSFRLGQKALTQLVMGSQNVWPHEPCPLGSGRGAFCKKFPHLIWSPCHSWLLSTMRAYAGPRPFNINIDVTTDSGAGRLHCEMLTTYGLSLNIHSPTHHTLHLLITRDDQAVPIDLHFCPITLSLLPTSTVCRSPASWRASARHITGVKLMRTHLYADDTKLYASSRPEDCNVIQTHL